MTIGLVLDPFGAPVPGSAGAFVPMIQALIKEHPSHTFICFVRKGHKDATARAYPGVEVRVIPSPVWLFGAQGLDASLDRYLFTTPIIPLFFRPRRAAVMVQDVAYLDLPARSVTERAARVALRYLHARSLRLATHIVSISEATKADLVRHFKTAPEKITVALLGFRALPETPTPIETPREYLFYVGALKPRKNIMRIIEAFAKAAERHPETHLLISGKTEGRYARELAARATTLGVASRVRFLGFLPDDELAYLYRNARAFVFPSLVEGFGVPILEAMSLECPVITSSTGACAEVAGDAAFLVDPYDTDAIARGMDTLLSDEGLRSELRTLGSARAREFSWERAARAVAQVLVYTP